MPIIMTNIGTIWNSTKNTDHQWRRFQKLINLSKVMAKTSHGPKSWPFPLYFEPILDWKYSFQPSNSHMNSELIFMFFIRGSEENGDSFKAELIQKQPFLFLEPPLTKCQNNLPAYQMRIKFTSAKFPPHSNKELQKLPTVTMFDCMPNHKISGLDIRQTFQQSAPALRRSEKP